MQWVSEQCRGLVPKGQGALSPCVGEALPRTLICISSESMSVKGGRVIRMLQEQVGLIQPGAAVPSQLGSLQCLVPS